MAVNYNDSRFQDVENEKNQAIQNTENTYNEMINGSDSYYQQQIDASKEYADKQTELQQAQTDFAIEKTEQAKDKAHKDYIKEQKGAYGDYQDAINPYGVNAEKMAEQGLHKSGYSKSVAINAYNTYQNRYMAARDSYNQAILNYDNAIKEAQLANNAALAQIAYQALQQQLELSLQGFQYKNTLVLQKLDAVNQEKDRYYQRYQDVLAQINTENALAEQIRQYNASLAFQKQQAAQEQANWEKEYALAVSSTLDNGGDGDNKGDTKQKDTDKKDTDKKETTTLKDTGNTSTKTSSSQAPVTKVNGTTYYQDATAAIKAAGYSAYSAEGALKKGIITSKIINGAIYYAPAKTSNTTTSSVNRPVQSTSKTGAIFQYGRYLDL